LRHCKRPDHNSRGCQLKKDCITSAAAKKLVAATAQQQPEPQIDEPVQIDATNIITRVMIFMRYCKLVVSVCEIQMFPISYAGNHT
jgi:hypothetical protein